MIRTFSMVSLSALAVAIATSQPAMASGIKEYLSDTDLASYCTAAGVDTETQATVTLADGTVLSGTIHCEAEDLVAGSDDVNDLLDDGEDDDSEDDDSEDDDSEDDDSEDDSDDSDDSSDDSDDDNGDDD